MRTATLSCCLLLLLGSTAAKAQKVPDYNFVIKETATAKKDIGKKFWMEFPVRVCPTPGKGPKEGCSEERGGFIVTGADGWEGVWVYYHVTFDNGKKGYIDYIGRSSWATKEPEPSPMEVEAKKDVGKTFWIGSVAPMTLCPGAKITEDCNIVRAGKFTVTDIVDSGGYSIDFFSHVTFDDGVTGYIQSLYDNVWLTEDPEVTKAKCVQAGQPTIGMTYDAAIKTCWGKPHKINRSITAAGTVDQAIYEEGFYLYFTNGVLTSVQEEQPR
jgi:hypothetical protein